MNQVFEYINYRWKAKGRHGIHSPFVYELVDKCLKRDLDREDLIRINDKYTTLLHDERKITIEDHGAGSKFLRNTRVIKSIAKASSSKGKYGRLLYRLSNYYKPKRILEFGTSLGIGTMYLALGNKKSEVVTVEGCSATFEIAKEDLPQNVQAIRSTFDDFLKTLDSTQKFDLIFIDGHHDGKALLDYLNRLEAVIHDDTFILLDDIRWSDSMLSAWKQIVESEKYHVTIDFFRIGLVLPRKQQVKEHFTLKL